MNVPPLGVAILYSTAQSRFCISASNVPGKDVQHVAIRKASIALFFCLVEGSFRGYTMVYHGIPQFQACPCHEFLPTTGQEYKFGDISKEAAKRAKNAVANLLGQERWLEIRFRLKDLPESDGKIYRLYRKPPFRCF